MTEDTPAKKKIIINLDNLNSTRRLKNNEYINIHHLERLKKLITDTVQSNSHLIDENHSLDSDECLIPLNQKPCFFIHGRRGSGKSTLLRGLRRELIENRTCEARHRISLLAHVDPTEFRLEESFFIYILSRIAEKLDVENRNFTQSNDHNINIRKEALKILHDMSNGLKMLYNTHETLYRSEDAAFFIEDSVTKCGSSSKLKMKFHELMEKLCKLNRTSAYLITIDDADLNSRKCSEILETVRNYMLCPHIIVVFAGDLNLYSTVIRGNILRNFDEMSLKYDPSRRPHRQELLDQLEDQYTLKLFPAQHRVELADFEELLNGNDERDYIIEYEGCKDEVLLSNYVNSCLNFLYPKNIVSDIMEYLLTLPIRSMLQLLKHWSQYIPNRTDDECKDDNNSVNRNIILDYKMYATKLAEGIKSVFSQNIIKHRINFTEVHKSRSHEIFKEILLHTAALGPESGSTKLISSVGQASDKLLSFYLNAEAIHYMSSYCRVLFYYTFVYTNIYYMTTMYDLKGVPSSNSEKERLRNKIIDQFYLTSQFEFTPDCPWVTAFLIRADEKKKDAQSSPGRVDEKKKDAKFCYGKGIIRFLDLDENKAPSLIKNFYNFKKFVGSLATVDKESEERKKNIYTFIHAIYRSICIIRTEKGVAYYLSIFALLAQVSNYLDKGNKNHSTVGIESIEDMLDLRPGFSSLCLIESFDKGEVPAYALFHKSFYTPASALQTHKDDLNASLLSWAKKYWRIPGMCYPASLDDAWNRFILRCELIEENYRSKSHGIGELFVDYYEAFVKSIKCALKTYRLGEKFEECLNSFPLWEAIKYEQRIESAIWKALNAIRIISPPKNNTKQPSPPSNEQPSKPSNDA